MGRRWKAMDWVNYFLGLANFGTWLHDGHKWSLFMAVFGISVAFIPRD